MNMCCVNLSTYIFKQELSYEDFVKQEKDQIKIAFDIAITKHMKILYEQEQDMKKMLNVEEEENDDKSLRF